MAARAAVSFSETMCGGFGWGATDPIVGAREGHAAASSLTLHAHAEIADVRAFVRDPGHGGRLRGSVTFAPIGAADATAEGTFGLFVPTAEPGVRLMTYRVAFRVDDRDYCLDGAKYVGRRSLLHGWSETTTLHCRLHAGADTTGAVVAAGVLHLGPMAFARQLTSFRTPAAGSLGDGVGALAGFLWFFSGELIAAYLPLAARR
ncbi:hypothetical protein [Luteitalea sp.]|uniref:hypothetical protein n=1 Tax=Luteitalea sp. TaxID=2004800 RepID=UPI0025C59B8A|nr:hypothetical protein [Luteitalea sp.]